MMPVCRYRSLLRVRWPLWVVACVWLVCRTLPVWADLAALEAEKKACLEELNVTNEAIAMANTAVAESGQVMAGIERALDIYVAARDAHAKALAQIRGKLREIDIQLAKLRSPNDLANAWAEYKNNRTPEQFIKLWKTARGVPPDHATLDDYDLNARILHKEITTKVVVPVGLALVKLGGLVKQINELAFNGVGICHPRDADGALEAVDELLGTMQKHFQKFETRFGLKDDKLLVAGVAVELSKNFQDLYDPQELLPEKLKDWAEALGDNKYVNWLPQKAIGKLQAEAEKMADEAYEQANMDLYGTTDRAGEYDKYQKLREDFEKAAEESERILAAAQQPVDEFARKVADNRARVERIQASFDKLLKRQAELEKRYLDLQADVFAERQRQLAKPVTGETLATGKPAFVRELFDEQGSSSVSRYDTRILAADDPTSLLLNLPREQRFGTETRVAQVVRSKEIVVTTDARGKQSEKIVTRIGLANDQVVYNYSPVKYSDGTGCVSVPASSRRMIGQKAGTARLKMTVTGYGGTTSDSIGNQILQTQELTSEETIQVVAAKAIEVRTQHDSANKPIERVDLVSTEAGYGRSSDLAVFAAVDWGNEVRYQLLDAAKLHFKLTGDPCVTVMRQANSVYLAGTNRPGDCTLEVSVAGSSKLAKRIRVTNSVVSAFSKLPDGETCRAGTDRGMDLPVGRAAELVVRIDGPAQADGFVVEWEFAKGGKVVAPGQEGVDARGGTGFGSDGGALACRLNLTLTNACVDLARAQKNQTWFERVPVRVAAQVRRRSTKEIVAGFTLGEFIPVVTIKELQVVSREGAGDGTVVQSIPLFLPGEAKHHQKPLALRLDLDSGDKLLLPLNAVAQPNPGTLIFTVDGANGNIIFNMANRGKVGWDEFSYRITADHARRMHLNLADGYAEARLQFSVNRLELWKRGTGARVSVFGPEKDRMDGYSVVWKSRTGTVTTAFKREQGTLVCDSPDNVELLEVILLNPRGAECAVIRGPAQGQTIETYPPDAAPEITVLVPQSMKAGAIVSLQAHGRGIPPTGPLSLAEAEFHTIWKTKSLHGKVRTEKGVVIPMGRDGFVSVGHIEILRTVPESGAEIPFEVELHRRTSWREAKPETRIIAVGRGTIRAVHNPSLPPFSGLVTITQAPSVGTQVGSVSQWAEGAPEVSLERMIPLDGNNPFNVQNPIVNATVDGVSYAATEAVLVTTYPEPPVPPQGGGTPQQPEEPRPGAPTVTTSATDKADGDRILAATGGTIVDTVTYANLVPGTAYTLDGELMNKATGQTTNMKTRKTFTPVAANGTVDQEFAVGSEQAGKTLVAYETVSAATGIVAQHRDINDAAQTITVQSPGAPPVPTLVTAAKDKADGDKTLPWTGGTIVDTVTYANLVPGTSYTLNGVLMNKATGQTTNITAQKIFTPGTANGSVEQEFAVPTAQAGKTLVVYERLSDNTGQQAEHANINDIAQTVTIQAQPAIILTTAAKDKADSDKTLPSTGGTIVDAVSFANLVPGTTYTLNGELMDKASGLSTGITAQKVFTPDTTNGTVNQEFAVTAAQAGKTLVVYERLSDNTGQKAAHTNINDAAQTVTIEAAGPSLSGVTGTTNFTNLGPNLYGAELLIDPNTGQGTLRGGYSGDVNAALSFTVPPTYNIGDGDPSVRFDRGQGGSYGHFATPPEEWIFDPAKPNPTLYEGVTVVFPVNVMQTLYIKQDVVGGAKIKITLTITRSGLGTAVTDYQLVIHSAEYVD